MFVIVILVLWFGWLGLRAYLRRNDPRGLALLTGEDLYAEAAPITRRAAAPQPAGEALPPAVGALRPRSSRMYAHLPGYDRRARDRRRGADRRTATRPSGDRRGFDRRSA